MTRPPSRRRPRPSRPTRAERQPSYSSPPTRTARSPTTPWLSRRRAGPVAIVLTNESSVPHNVAIERDGSVIVEGEIFSGGGTRTTATDLVAGTYAFFCSVPGHREGGMEGILNVE